VKQFYFFEEYADSMLLKRKTFTCCFSREGFCEKSIIQGLLFY